MRHIPALPLVLCIGLVLTGCNSTASGSVPVHGAAFDHPSALALDNRGDIYVADAGHSRIVMFSPKGKTLTAWSTNPHNYGCDDAPDDVQVDSERHVYVWAGGFCASASSSSHPHQRIMEFSARGTLLHTWSQDNVEIAMVNTRAVYVCKGYVSGSRVRHLPSKYCEGGGRRTIDRHGNIYSTYSTELTRPNGVYCSRNCSSCKDSITGDPCTPGPIPDDAAIAKFSPAGRNLQRYGDWLPGNPDNAGPGVRGEYRFNNPGGIAVDAAGDLYVTDDNTQDNATGYHEPTHGSVVKLSPGGRTLAVWTAFQAPAGLAVDTHGAVFVLDSGANRLVKFSANGRRLRVWEGS